MSVSSLTAEPIPVKGNFKCNVFCHAQWLRFVDRRISQRCVCNQGAFADNCADAVDRLLIVCVLIAG